MTKFRKRPVVINAEEWYPGAGIDGVEEKSRIETRTLGDPDDCVAVIKTLEGSMVVESGDWIITGSKGEKYPCKPDIFALTYEIAQ